MKKNQDKQEKKNENIGPVEAQKVQNKVAENEKVAENQDKIRLKELEKEAEQMRDKFMRTYAEMENIKKRAQNEIEKNAKIAIADFALALLPVADNLERALNQEIPAELQENQFIKNLLAGVQMTQKQLSDAFAKNGVVAIESIGKPFDPNTQKAIQQIVDNDKEDGTVVQEWQKGYTIAGDRVLREAMVIVSKKE
ncbi:MAG: nucleotide exchange factor GrpE [Alphaproteobacteria bacterium]|nr:nucleotide exchange factor GrpE [Alphaproteobacteria bacterium]